MKIKPLHPLVSCICITNNRPEMLLKAILSFDQQNYPNTELVISYPENDIATKTLITQVSGISDIKILSIQRAIEETIGTARNNAVAACNGDYVCMWDDDDIYYFTRIADQYNLLQGSGRYFQSSMISQIILFDAVNNKAYLSSPYDWSGTLLCKKTHLQQYPCTDSNQFECAPVISYLDSNKFILRTGFSPQLYTYVYHGSNNIEYFHFQYLTRKSEPLQQEFSQNIANYLENKIKLNVS